jgi:hypothetical protein
LRCFAQILNGKYDAAEVRLHNFIKMNAIPAYYEAAKKSNIESYSRTYSFAIAQNLGGSTVLKRPAYCLEESKLPELKTSE